MPVLVARKRTGKILRHCHILVFVGEKKEYDEEKNVSSTKQERRWWAPDEERNTGQAIFVIQFEFL